MHKATFALVILIGLTLNGVHSGKFDLAKPWRLFNPTAIVDWLAENPFFGKPKKHQPDFSLDVPPDVEVVVNLIKKKPENQTETSNNATNNNSNSTESKSETTKANLETTKSTLDVTEANISDKTEANVDPTEANVDTTEANIPDKKDDSTTTEKVTTKSE